MTTQPHEVSSVVTAERLAAKATARGEHELADRFTARARALRATASTAKVDWGAIHDKIFAERAAARLQHQPARVKL
jgi:hypothetical protein